MTQKPSFSASSRREFMQKVSAASVGAFVGMTVPFAKNWPASGLIPVAHAGPAMKGKHAGLIVLNDRPFNAELPPELLDDDVTPAEKMFVRNNGVPPVAVDEEKWTLSFEGESLEESKSFTLAELKKSFKSHTYQLVLECGGNGRSEFRPNAQGNQWSMGAVSCAQWTGVRLKDVLASLKVKKDAVYIGYYGADTHLTGDKSRVVISRGMPMEKAMMDETLLAFEMNGAPIPAVHGAPLRMIAGGWPASVSGKWLQKLVIRNKVHDGQKMGGKSYRVPCKTVAPGTKVKDDEMCIIESMPVKSLITTPASGIVHPQAKSLKIAGHAWAGELSVKEVHVSIDFGSTWQKAKLKKAANRLSWQRFEAEVKFEKEGYYEVWAKATDENGRSQPMVVPGWNPKGYLNNACHRIAAQVVKS